MSTPICSRGWLVGLVCGAIAMVAEAQDLVVKIGHVGPVSGAIAHLGKDNENGARMAIDELNAKGVSIGGKRTKFELLAEDDAADPKQGTAAAQKLVDAKVNGVVGHLNSGTSIPASKIYSDAGIPQISPSATNPKFTRQGYKTTFRMVADDVQLARTLGEYAVKILKVKSIVMVSDQTAYGNGLTEEFERGVRAAGGTINARETTSDKATSFTTLLYRLKNAKPELVFFGGMDSVAGPLLREMKNFGVNAKFVGGDGICSAELPKLAAGSIADGQVICAEAGGIPSNNERAMRDFAERFKRKFSADVQMYSPYVYDAVMVMANAMVKANSAEPSRYLPVLAKTEGYRGITGTISFDSRGDLAVGLLTVYSFDRDGRRRQVAILGAPSTAPRVYVGGGSPRRSDLPEREPSKGPPKDPTVPWVPGNKDLGSHRASGDAAGSPVVVAALTGSSPANNTQGMDTMAQHSKWGGPRRAKECLEALQRLSAKGLVDDFSSRLDTEGKAAERAFAAACLGAPDQRLAPRVGRLRGPRGVECTVTLLSADTALTARHCVFTHPRVSEKGTDQATAATRPDDLKQLTVEFGPIGQPKRSGLKTITVRDQTGWRRIDVDGNEEVVVITLNGIEQIQGDSVLLALASPIQGVAETRFRVATPMANDQIYMAGYYPGHVLDTQEHDTGIRQQRAGYCQVVEVAGRCFAHGCATNGASSGSAMFVERADASNQRELVLIGVHSSGASPDPHTKCSIKPVFTSHFNIGVLVRTDDITQR